MSYSDEFRTEAMVRLAINRYDYDKTAQELEVAPNTLRNWDKQYPKVAIPEMLDRAIERLLAALPDHLERMEGDDLAVTIGILVDKWLVMQGEPTSRSESIVRGIEDVTDEERELVTARAREIIAELGTESAGERSDNGANPA